MSTGSFSETAAMPVDLKTGGRVAKGSFGLMSCRSLTCCPCYAR